MIGVFSPYRGIHDGHENISHMMCATFVDR